MNLRIGPLLLLFLAFPGPLLAAEDNQLWTSARLRYTTVNAIKVDVIQHLRWDQNASEFLSAMPEFGVKLSPYEDSSVGIGYRFLHKRSGSGDFERAHRFQLHGDVEYSIGRVHIGYRVQGQTRYKPKDEQFDTSLRNRLGLTVDTNSPLAPLFTVESFSDLRADGLQRSNIRSALGGSIRLNKRHRLKLRYLHDVSVEGSEDVERILAVDYQHRYKASSDQKGSQ